MDTDPGCGNTHVASIPELSELCQAMAAGQLEECYKLVSADRITQTVITPALVDAVANIVWGTGLTRITSVGCGTGLFEWFLAKRLGHPVLGIEKGPYEDDGVPNFGGDDVVFRYTAKEALSVDPDTALLFSWGTKAPWPEYLKSYSGRCVIFIHPEDFMTKVPDTELAGGWHLKHTDDAFGIRVFGK